MSELITAELVRLDADLGTEKHNVIRRLAEVVAAAGRTGDVGQLIEDALAREATAPTGLKDGIAIPHCRTTAVEEPTLVFARLAPAVEFGAKDGPADLAFLIAAPVGDDDTHLKILTSLARALVRPEFTEGLRRAASTEEVVSLVGAAVETPAQKQEAPVGAAAGGAAGSSAPQPAASSRSPPVPPASHTPTWPPRPSRTQPREPAST